MSRPAHQPATSGPLLPIALLLLAVASLLPARFLGWVPWLGDQTAIVLAPIAQPVTGLGRLFTPPRKASEIIDPEDAIATIEDLQTRIRQLERENDNLLLRIEEISRAPWISDYPTSVFLCPVISPDPQLMRVRGGESKNISRSTIATVGVSQLVGRVERVNGPTCLVRPITARGDEDASKIQTLILPDPSSASGRSCLLTPVGDGTLVGDVESPKDASATDEAVVVGQTVVLNDDQWPRHAQMFVVGLVESVQPHPANPLRQLVTVRPTVRIRSVAEVYLRVPIAEGSG